MSFSTAFRAQFRRDLAEWWPLWAASVAAGLIPLLLPVIYSARGEEALDLRVAAVAVGGGLFWLASIGLLGDGLASRDLGEGRYAFFASRPVGDGAFWLARVCAALLLLAAITVSLLLPAWLVAPPDAASREPAMNPWTLPMTSPGVDLSNPWAPYYSGEGVLSVLTALGPLGLLGALLSLLLLAHLVSTTGRSRDAWTLLDFGGFFLVVVLVLSVRDTLLSAHAFAALVAAERLFAVATGAILLLAGWRQIAQGRVDLARGHGAFSRVAWPALVVAALLLLAVSSWVAHPEPGDLLSAKRVHPTSDGRVALVTGPMAHRLGLRSGVVFSEGESSAVTGPVHTVASADRAERLAWTRCRRLGSLDCEVWTWSTGLVEPRVTGIFSDRWDHSLSWSPHGELLALAHDRIEVWQPVWANDTAAPRLLYARDLDESYPIEPAFLSARRLRYLIVNPDIDFMRVEEVDLPSRSVRVVGDLPGEAPLQIVTSPSGRYVAATSMIPSRTSILDAESGRVYEFQDHPLLAGRFLASIRFIGDRSLYLLTTGDADWTGEWGLVHVDLDALWNEGPELAFREVPVPPIRSHVRLGVREGALLLSAGGDRDSVKPRLVLPDRVEPLDGHAVWEQSPNGAWHPLVDGVRLAFEPVRLAPQRDDSAVIAGDGTVLRLTEDGLEVTVPALPETEPDWPRRF